MLRKAGKPDFMNTRALRVCEKVTTGSDRKQEKPILTQFWRKSRIAGYFLGLAAVNFIKFWCFDQLKVFRTVKWGMSVENNEDKMKAITRRQFMKRTTSTALAGATISAVPFSRVLGANDDIRMGVVGIGSTVKGEPRPGSCRVHQAKWKSRNIHWC